MPLRTGSRLAALITVAALAWAAPGPAAQNAAKPWTQVTEWGDPDLTGMWPVTHLNGTPVQRPAQFGERRFLTDDEFAERQKQIALTTERTAGAWAEIGQANRLTSLVVDPANGRLPPLTDEGMRRAKTMTSSWSDMSFNRVQDFNALDRCITRGLPASMFPFMYNSGMAIVQAPGYVVIRLEIIHETRVIAVDPVSRSPAAQPRPRLATAIRQWLGDSRGRWEGRTLVVETTNFNGRFPMMIQGPGGTGIPTSESLRVTERFTRVDEDTIDYELSVDDPVVLTRPWKAAFAWKRDPSYYIYEYGCHEGNQAISNALRNSRYLESQP
jgi:hypothetical protein